MVRMLLLFLLALGMMDSARAQLMPTPLPVAPTTTPGVVTPPAGAPATGSSYAPSAASSALPVGIASLTNGYVADDSYKLRVGDTVSFQIVEDRILKLQLTPTSLVVMDSGEMDVPYIGRVMAVDKTCKQLAEEIEKQLKENYYKKATVVLSLNVANRLLGRVYVWGQVRNQGAIDLMVNEEMTVGKAIMRAGGFSDFANKRKVKVVRSSAEGDGKTQSFDLDMADILDKGDISKDMVLKPNDLIIVSSRLINF